MTAAWPASLPVECDQHAYQETPQPATIRFEPEVGEPIGRGRSTVQLDLVTFAFVLTSDEAEIFRTFVRKDLAGGVLPFTIRHPRSAETVTAQLAGETPYRIAAFSPGAWTVTFTALVKS